MERRTFFKKLVAVAAVAAITDPSVVTVNPAKPIYLGPHDLGPHVTVLPPGWKMKQYEPSEIAAWPSDWEVFEQQPGTSKWVRMEDVEA